MSCPQNGAYYQSVRGPFREVMRPVLRKNAYVGKLLIVSDTEDLRKQQRHLLWLCTVLLIITMMLGAWCGNILQRNISGPVNQLVTAMRTVTAE